MSASPVELRRRALMDSDPELYDYIAALAQAKALDSAGDEVSGFLDTRRATNAVWRRAADMSRLAKTISEESR